MAGRRALDGSLPVGRPSGLPLEVHPVLPVAAPRPGALVLSDFATSRELARWVTGPGVAADLVWPRDAPRRSAARVVFPAGSLSGFMLPGLPRDWGPYDELRIEVYARAADLPLALGVRIDDRRGGPDLDSRYETTAPLAEGWSEVTVSLVEVAARVDMTGIRRLILYAVSDPAAPAPPVLLLSRVTLHADPR